MSPGRPRFLDETHAPFILFDDVSNSGSLDGIVALTLTAQAMLPDDMLSRVEVRHLAVAYLRCGRRTAIALRRAIDNALRIGAEPTGGDRAGERHASVVRAASDAGATGPGEARTDLPPRRRFADEAHAPFVFFDGAPNSGAAEDIITITLTAQAMLPDERRSGVDVRILAVAYLRCGRRAAAVLGRAIDTALLIGAKAQGGRQ